MPSSAMMGGGAGELTPKIGKYVPESAARPLAKPAFVPFLISARPSPVRPAPPRPAAAAPPRLRLVAPA